MNTPTTLKIGDRVRWSGGFGAQRARPAVVTGIVLTELHEKYGTTADSVSWSRVRQNCAVVDLDNGHWAYGSQIEPWPECTP